MEKSNIDINIKKEPTTKKNINKKQLKKNYAVKIVKKKKLQTNNEINIAHAYKSMKTSSSKRTIVFKHGMEVDLKKHWMAKILYLNQKI